MSKAILENYPAIVGGEKLEGAAAFENINPSTGQAFSTVARCGSEEIDQAVEAARQTYETTWRKTTPPERARVLHKIAERINLAGGYLT